MKGIVCVFSVLIITLNLSYAQVNDSTNTSNIIDVRDGKTYKTVKIGLQVWMAENLSYNPGNGSWNYDNNSKNKETYGLLYNWETAKTVCPSGWHLPSDSEWTQLMNYLGGEDIAGGKLKETSNLYWKAPNTGATNETCFTALPGGMRGYTGPFVAIGFYGFWWSSTEANTDAAWNWSMFAGDKALHRGSTSKKVGYSVRCIRN